MRFGIATCKDVVGGKRYEERGEDDVGGSKAKEISSVETNQYAMRTHDCGTVCAPSAMMAKFQRLKWDLGKRLWR